MSIIHKVKAKFQIVVDIFDRSYEQNCTLPAVANLNFSEILLKL